MVKSNFIRSLIDGNEEFRCMPSRTFARYLVKEYPHEFSNIEAARTLVREVRGKAGTRNRDVRKGKSGYFDPQINFKVPESFADEYAPFVIPKNYDNILMLNDIHAPFHDEEALATAVRFGKDRGVNAVMLNGDNADQYWASHFVKIGHKHPFTYQEEIDVCNRVLDYLQDEFDGCKFFYKIGNHEMRLEAYMAKLDIKHENFKIESLLEMIARGFDIIEPGQYWVFDKLIGVHGHEWGSKGAYSLVNMARSLFNKAKQSAICGHGHTTSEHTEPRADGGMLTTWSVGCLCDLHPAYAPLNKWNHGCARLYMDNGYMVENRRIYRGKLL